MKTRHLLNIRSSFIGEVVAIWTSVIIGIVLHLRIPISPWIAIPVGLALWLLGFAYTLHLRRELREAWRSRTWPRTRRGFPIVEARAAMHFGVAIISRSWPTLGVALVCSIFNLALAFSLHRKIEAGQGSPQSRSYR